MGMAMFKKKKETILKNWWATGQSLPPPVLDQASDDLESNTSHYRSPKDSLGFCLLSTSEV